MSRPHHPLALPPKVDITLEVLHVPILRLGEALLQDPLDLGICIAQPSALSLALHALAHHVL